MAAKRQHDSRVQVTANFPSWIHRSADERQDYGTLAPDRPFRSRPKCVRIRQPMSTAPIQLTYSAGDWCRPLRRGCHRAHGGRGRFAPLRGGLPSHDLPPIIAQRAGGGDMAIESRTGNAKLLAKIANNSSAFSHRGGGEANLGWCHLGLASAGAPARGRRRGRRGCARR